MILLVSLYIGFVLLSGPIVVGVAPRLPMKDLSMLLGNELSGGKVTIHPKVTLELATSIEIEKIEEENPSYAVTRAQDMKS